eukprot:scaffold2135_cov145-Isochrysis_galbana.AAC.1
MDIASSPKRPRDPAQDNEVSQRATPFDPAMLEIQVRTTHCLLREPARACQSLAHHTTLTGRCPKSVDTWAPLCEEPQSRSTTSNARCSTRRPHFLSSPRVLGDGGTVGSIGISYGRRIRIFLRILFSMIFFLMVSLFFFLFLPRRRVWW